MLATQGLVHQGKILDLLIKLKKAQFSPSLWTAYWRLAFVFWRKIYLCRVLLIFSQVHPSRRCPNLQNEWLYEVTWQREIKVAGGIKGVQQLTLKEIILDSLDGPSVIKCH